MCMKIYIDNEILNHLNDFQDHLNTKTLHFNWSTLLTSLKLEQIYKNIPPFTSDHKTFTIFLEWMGRECAEDLVIEIYDQLFIECLTSVKQLPELQYSFLLQKIKIAIGQNSLIDPPLKVFLAYLEKEPSFAMHDLILYLAWDRMCIALGIVFEQTLQYDFFLANIAILKKCLIESFIHIKMQGRTNPNFFRLAETIYAYQMREENLQTYPEEEWQILCKMAIALRDREALPNVPYIDQAINSRSQLTQINAITLDNLEKVKASILLSNYVLTKCDLQEFGFSSQVELFHDNKWISVKTD